MKSFEVIFYCWKVIRHFGYFDKRSVSMRDGDAFYDIRV